MTDEGAPQLKSAFTLLSWGRRDAAELADIFGNYLENGPIYAQLDTDSVNGDALLNLYENHPLPSDELEKLLHTSSSHLKHALDHALNASLTILTGSRVQASFPWTKDRHDFEAAIGRLKEKFPNTNTVAFTRLCKAIETFQPYFEGETWPGGNTAIRELAKSVNEAKHRLTVGLRLSKKNLEIEVELAPEGVASVDPAPWIPGPHPHELARASTGSKIFLHIFPLSLRLSIIGFPNIENVSVPEMLLVLADKVQTFLTEVQQTLDTYPSTGRS